MTCEWFGGCGNVGRQVDCLICALRRAHTPVTHTRFLAAVLLLWLLWLLESSAFLLACLPAAPSLTRSPVGAGQERDKFTLDEWDTVNDVLASPDYYA
jgi:hypothetical protein